MSGKALKRQVAFLFDFEEIEHTTVLGLTLQDIIKAGLPIGFPSLILPERGGGVNLAIRI